MACNPCCGKPVAPHRLEELAEHCAEQDADILDGCQSVYDYVNIEGGSHSSDKRMAIEGALLREGMPQPRTELKWVDGSQNLADILTKSGACMDYMREYLRSCLITWTQCAAAVRVKEQKRKQRTTRKEKLQEKKSEKHDARRADAVRRLADQEQAAG